MVNPREIKQAARRIARQFQPERIVLFGSYAYGKPTDDSDVDLLILVKGNRVHDRAIRIRMAIDFPFPVDLVVRSCGEFTRRIASGDFFLKEIQEKGKVLYETPDARMGQESRRRFRHRPARIARRKSPNYDSACFHAQQCVEKYFKGRLQEAGIAFPHTHDLMTLLNLILPLEPLWSGLAASAMRLTQHAVKTRYPGSWVTRTQAQSMVQRCREIRVFARQGLGLKT